MKKQYVEELKSIAPTFYEGYRDFGVGNGWFGLLKQASIEIQQAILKMPEEERSRVKCAQIKEKFGGLRFYTDGANEEIDEITDRAEASADGTCENCGAPGQSRSGGWIKTLCENCPRVEWDRD